MKQLMNNRCVIKNIASFNLRFVEEDNTSTTKYVDVHEGDKVVVQYYDVKSGIVITDRGVVTNIDTTHFNTSSLSSFVVLTIDFSKAYKSNIVRLESSRVIDITVVNDFDNIDNNVISTGMVTYNGNPMKITDNELEIPFSTLAKGTLDVLVYNMGNNELLFHARKEITVPNLNDSVKWCLRNLNGIEENITYDKDLIVESEKYVFREQDREDELVQEWITDNSKLVSAGTDCEIVIQLKDKYHNTQIIGSSRKACTITSEYIEAATTE